MLETIAVILVGMGLLFYGMKIVRIETKQLTSRHLRILLEKWTSNRFMRMVFGFVSGAVTHSGSSASLIITNLVQSRLISVKNALPILAAANVGTVAIVFMFAINIKLGIMYLLGITAMLYSLNKKAAKLPLIGVILGLSILLFGFQQLETGAEHLLEMEIIHSWISSMQNYFLFSIVLIVLGFTLRLITQSSSTVAILVISLGLTGVISDVQIMAMLIGAPIGAGVAMIFESKEVEGSTKQIPIFQIFYEFAGSTIFGILLIIELLTGLPLINSCMSSLFHNTPEYVAVTLLLLRLIPFIIAIIFQDKIAAILERKFPLIKEETLASPQFIYDQAVEDPETAIELIEQEVFRVINRFPTYMENVRVEHENTELIDNIILHDATVKLGRDIDLFIKDMFNSNLSHETSERLIKIQNKYSIIMLLEENINSIVKEILANPVPDDLMKLRINIVESLYAVLVICSDSISDEDFLIEQLIHMTSDKGSLMETIRNKYLSDYEDPSGNIRKTMMYVTDLYQRIIWLVNKWALSA